MTEPPVLIGARALPGHRGTTRVIGHDPERGDLVVLAIAPPDGPGAVEMERAVSAGAVTAGMAGVLEVRAVGTTAAGSDWMCTVWAGRDLATRLDQRPRVDPGAVGWTELIRAAADTARTIERLAGRGVVHADVCPANIAEQTDTSGRPVWTLLDLGRVSLLDGPLPAGGTRPYAPPECWVGGRAAPTTDVFGLCATLWHVLAGAPPFGPDDADLGIRLHYLPPGPVPAAWPPGLRSALTAGLRTDPARRPAPGALAAALDEVVAPAPRLRWLRGRRPR